MMATRVLLLQLKLCLSSFFCLGIESQEAPEAASRRGRRGRPAIMNEATGHANAGSTKAVRL